MAFNWQSEKTFAGNSQKQDKLSDTVETVSYPEGKYAAYRFIGDPRGTALHWLSTKMVKKGEKKPKISNFPKQCLGFNPETMEVDAAEKCPYCTLLGLNPRVELRQNVIDRALQAAEPRRPQPLSKKERRKVEILGGTFHVKEGKDVGGWTPVRVMTVIPAIGTALVELTSLNEHKTKSGKKAYGPDHPKFGYDVKVKHSPKEKAPQNIYKTQKGDVVPYTEDELEYAIWDIPEHKTETEKAAEKEAKRVMPFLCNREGELIFPDAGSGKEGKKKNRFKDQFDEEEDLENEDDDDDDDDDRKSKKPKGKAKGKKASNWDDDDEDEDDDEAPFDTDDDDEDEEDEDERPSKKKSSKTKIKVGKVKAKVKSKRSAKITVKGRR